MGSAGDTGTLPMWLTSAQAQLLMAAELIIREDYCQNRCRHRKANRKCFDCPDFDVKIGGYLECCGYEEVVKR